MGKELIFMEFAKLLTVSGCAAILFSCFVGAGMSFANGKIHVKSLGSAHLDWIMLGLMSCAAAGLIYLFKLSPPAFAVWFMIFGAWMNPMPYVFRAFGINAFKFEGGTVQKSAALMGIISSLSIIIAWIVLFIHVWDAWG